MGIWTNYLKKSLPEDNDGLMLCDSSDGKNKQVLFSSFWNWITKKLNEAQLANLQTTNKTLIGAVNELKNGAIMYYASVFGKTLTVENVRAASHALVLIDNSVIALFLYRNGDEYMIASSKNIPDGVTFSNEGKTITIQATKDRLITCIYPTI